MVPLDSDGRFAQRFAPGTYDVDLRRGPGTWAPATDDLVVGSEPEQHRTLTVVGARIDGRARTHDGTPPGTHGVMLWIRRKGVKGGDRYLTGWDDEGRFVIYGRVPGEHVISASAPGLRSAVKEVTIGEDDVRVSVELTLELSGTD